MDNDNGDYDDFGCTQVDDTVQHQFSNTQVEEDSNVVAQTNVNSSNNNVNDNKNDQRNDENIVEVDDHEKHIEAGCKEDDDNEENDVDQEEEEEEGDEEEEEEDDDDDDEESASRGAKAAPKMAITQDLNPISSPAHDDDDDDEEEEGGNSNQQQQHVPAGILGSSSAQKSERHHVPEVAEEVSNVGTSAGVDEKKDDNDEEEENDDEDDDDDDDESASQGAKAVPKMAITQDMNPYSPSLVRKNRVQDDGDDDDGDDDDGDDDTAAAAAAAVDNNANKEGNHGAGDQHDNDDDDDLLHDDIHNDPPQPIAADVEDDAEDMAGNDHDKGAAMVVLTGTSTAMVILTGSSTTSGHGAGETHMTNDNTCLEDPYGGSSPTQYTPGLPLPAPKPPQRSWGRGPSPGPAVGPAAGHSRATAAGMANASDTIHQQVISIKTAIARISTTPTKSLTLSPFLTLILSLALSRVTAHCHRSPIQQEEHSPTLSIANATRGEGSESGNSPFPEYQGDSASMHGSPAASHQRATDQQPHAVPPSKEKNQVVVPEDQHPAEEGKGLNGIAIPAASADAAAAAIATVSASVSALLSTVSVEKGDAIGHRAARVQTTTVATAAVTAASTSARTAAVMTTTSSSSGRSIPLISDHDLCQSKSSSLSHISSLPRPSSLLPPSLPPSPLPSSPSSLLSPRPSLVLSCLFC